MVPRAGDDAFRLTGLATTALLLLLAPAAHADWADEGESDERGASSEDLEEHLERAEALAVAPSIPLMVTGLVIGGPASVIAGLVGSTTDSRLLSHGGGFMIGASLNTSIAGALIGNGLAGTRESWSLFISGASLSVPGFILFQGVIQDVVQGNLFGGVDISLGAPPALIGLSMIIVGEILTMSSAGVAEDDYSDRASIAPRLRRPAFALAPMATDGGGGLLVAGTF